MSKINQYTNDTMKIKCQTYIVCRSNVIKLTPQETGLLTH